MSAVERQLAGDPVLVDRAEALAILGVTASTFSRLCRERRFEDMGGRGLWRSAELRRYRAADRRRGGFRQGVTNAFEEAKETAPESVTPSAQIARSERNHLGLGDDTLHCCEGCGHEFRPRRADARTCSPRCRQRVSRRARRRAA
jgi:hypothetical protein